MLAYGKLNNDDEAIQHVLLTLRRMAMGGIYDQIGGGFARYSTDMAGRCRILKRCCMTMPSWFPYTHAWQVELDPLFKQVVEETIAFVQRELMSPEGIFYSSWTRTAKAWKANITPGAARAGKRVDDLLPAARDYYAINANGHLENGRYILLRQGTSNRWLTGWACRRVGAPDRKRSISCCWTRVINA